VSESWPSATANGTEWLCLKSRKMPRACPVVLHVCRYLPNQTKQLDATALRRGGSRFHN